MQEVRIVHKMYINVLPKDETIKLKTYMGEPNTPFGTFDLEATLRQAGEPLLPFYLNFIFT